MIKVPKVIGRLPKGALAEAMWCYIHIQNEFRDQPVIKVIEYDECINIMYAFTNGGTYAYLLYALTLSGEPLEFGLNVIPIASQAYPGPNSAVVPLNDTCSTLQALRSMFQIVNSMEYTRIAAGDIEIMK